MTITRYAAIQPRDPLIARDGRPFGADSGHRMRSHDWPLPSVAAGALRTLLGRKLGGNFSLGLIAELKSLVCRGPLPTHGGRLFVPAPDDVLRGRDKTPLSLRPVCASSGGGTDLPCGLSPVLAATRLGKAGSGPAWWSLEKAVEWLLIENDVPPNFFDDATQFRDAPERDERIHLKIDPQTLASKEGMLFSTIGLALDDPHGEAALAMSASHAANSSLNDAWTGLPSFQPFGGERRLAEFAEDAKQESLWKIPAALKEQLSSRKAGSKLRMALASPAIFSNGWSPGWLNNTTPRIGSPPSLRKGELTLKLVAVANQRWQAVSGWSYESPTGPKAIRRMVPAGGVYFFEVETCSDVDWDDLWLASVSDDIQDRNDGFGLALWGLWDERKGAF